MLERRRSKRYRVRLDLQLALPSGVELVAELFDLSTSGCLLVSMVRLQPGQQLRASIPSMPGTAFHLQVVRTRAFGLWNASAARFQPELSEDTVQHLVERSGQGTPDPAEIL